MSEDIRNLDINAIVERIQDASELSYNYYKPLVDRIIAEKASEKEVESLRENVKDFCKVAGYFINGYFTKRW